MEQNPTFRRLDVVESWNQLSQNDYGYKVIELYTYPGAALFITLEGVEEDGTCEAFSEAFEYDYVTNIGYVGPAANDDGGFYCGMLLTVSEDGDWDYPQFWIYLTDY